jgi:hypothetical protein
MKFSAVRLFAGALLPAAAMVFSVSGRAAQPEIRTARGPASSPSAPHETCSGCLITLKGVSSLSGPRIRATWDFGDGSAASTSTLSGTEIAAQTHRYFGEPGSAFTARLTVTDESTGEESSATFPVALREKSLTTEVHAAVEEGLWQLYQDLRGVQPDAHLTALAVLAFERNGHLESGGAEDPYTEIVARGLQFLLESKSADPWIAIAFRAAGAPSARTLSRRTYQQILDSLPVGKPLAGASDEERLLTLSEQGIGPSDGRWATLEMQIRDANNFDLDAERLMALNEALEWRQPIPLPYLRSSAGLGDFDWYAAERAHGATADGLARTILDRQVLTASSGQAGALPLAQSILSLSLRPYGQAASSVNNVTSAVNVVKTALVLNRATGLYSTTVTVTNISGQSIPGPLTMGIDALTATVTLTNSNGTFNGDPYVTLQSGALAASTAVSVSLSFNNPPKGPVNFTPTIYSGTFPPTALQLTCPASTAATGTAYSSSLIATGSVLPYAFSISVGSLPHNLSLNASTGAISGTPDTAGNVSFTAKVTDSSGGVAQTQTAACSISVGAGDQAPVAGAQSLITSENGALPITLSATDADGDGLTFAIVTPPSNGALGSFSGLSCSGNPSTCTVSVTYTPNSNYLGPDSFTFKANDGQADSTAATVSLAVSIVDTTQADFGAGSVTNTDRVSSPNNVVLASGNADQQNLTTNSRAIIISPTSWGGQTFTAGVSGLLGKVQILIYCSLCTGPIPDVTVSVRATSGGLPTGSDLATGTITGISNNQAYLYAVFSTPLAITAGTQYAILIRPNAIPSGNGIGLIYNGTDVYPGGARLVGANSGTSWSVQILGGTSSDIGFRAIVLGYVDQQQTSSPAAGVGITTTSWAGQTFTAGISGLLSRVDVDLACYQCTGTTPDLTVSLRATAGGMPTGPDLATATITGFSAGADAYYTAVFSPPLAVTAGTQYAIVIRPTSDPSQGIGYVWLSTNNDAYAGGTLVYSLDPGGTAWNNQVGGGTVDALFRTYVDSYIPSGQFVSSVKDSGGGAVTWNTLSWTATVPANSTLKFQVAASNSSSGPFNFAGPDGTSATYFTTSGASLGQFSGMRYLQYQAFFTTTDATVTPSLHDVTLSLH